MAWLAWRQFRLQVIATVAAFVVLGVVLAYTGPHVVHLYHASGIQACQASHGDCGPLVDTFTSHYVWWHGLGAIIIVIPPLIGVFWGAPLFARELETGTHRLAWTQSVTRTRWLATKFALISIASVITAAAFSVVIALWISPFDKVAGNRFSPGTFSQRGIVPIAYALFAFALGVAAGAVIRRVLPAMVATLLGFAAVRLVVQQWVRPHLATPLHVTSAVFDRFASLGPSVWVISTRIVDTAGHTVNIDRDTIRTRCNLPEGDFSRTALAACAHRLGLHGILTIQPAHRYWPFQWWEFAIFIALSVLLAGFAFWWTRHRIT
jgi:hypothetical protein